MIFIMQYLSTFGLVTDVTYSSAACRRLPFCAIMGFMSERPPTYHDYAVWAAQTVAEISHDCEISAFHATGHGGQCVNTTDSAVRMRHVPSGLVVVSRESRSQFRNRQLCLQKLREEFAHRAVVPTKRVPTKVPRGARERRLKEKQVIARKKKLRRVNRDADD